MFEIEVFDNKATDSLECSIRADFSVPITKFSVAPPELNQSVFLDCNLEKDHYNFNVQLSVSIMEAHYFNSGSLVGRMFRGKFLEAFSHKSTDSIQRAMRFMADQMKHDPGFELGLLHGSVVSYTMPSDQIISMLKWKPNQGYNHSDHSKSGGYVDVGWVPATGGYLNSASPYMSFSQKAESFSRGGVFFQTVAHPVDGRKAALRGVIMDLNDRHGWTREQIADWLETLDININMKPKERANG